MRRAISELAKLGPGRASSLYRSEPLGDPAQPWFVNAVFELETELSPEELLGRLQELERAAGKRSGAPEGAGSRRLWIPRVIDLDLLLQSDRMIDTPRLSLPHPRFRERRFVLEPLAELAPGLRDPKTGQTIASLLRHLDDGLQVEKLSGSEPESPGASGPSNPARRPRRPEYPEVWFR